MLQAASMGIERVYLHSTPNRLFSVFQPKWRLTNGAGIECPHIMPMYNGLLIVNGMVGTSGKAKVAELENTDAGLASYAVWEDGKLSKMVLIDSNVHDQSASIRSALNVTPGGGSTGGSVSVKRLSIPDTTATEGITLAGQSFESVSGAPTGDVVTEQVQRASITIVASEVVEVTFI